MREFTTAAKAVVEEDEGASKWIEFKVDGKVLRAVKKPSDGQVAFLMAATSSKKSGSDRVAGLLNFFDSALDDDSQVYISEKMLDPNDEFGIEEIQSILEYLMGEWSGRPTQRQPVSTPPPPPTGPSSNLPIPAPTS